MCRVAGCSNDTDYVDLASHHPEIFGQKSDGGPDYCKIRPLKQHPYLDYQPRGETCTNASFDFRQTPQKYCSDYSDVVYAPFAMNQTFVTEFGLVCDDQYKVGDPFFVHFYYDLMILFRLASMAASTCSASCSRATLQATCQTLLAERRH